MADRADENRWLRGADILWIFALMGYVLAGTALVPFHADESTQIMMSRDYHYQFVAGDWEQVFYHDPALNETEQQLRLLNGTLAKTLFGVAWDAAGLDVEDLNEQWLWGAGFDWNEANGHRPTHELLRITRWTAALSGALAVPVMFVLAWFWRKRSAAYPAAFLLATHAAVLIHVRRAYTEASLLLFSLLVVLLAVAWLRRQSHGWILPLLLGAASGLAVASKHSGAVVVVAAYVTLFGVSLWRTREERGAWVVRLVISGILSLAVFGLMNPAWWSNPVARAGEVLALRTSLVRDQAAVFPEAVYPDAAARLGGLLRHLSVAPPEYYEVAGWDTYIGPEIVAYAASPWVGIPYGVGVIGQALGMVLLLGAGIGAVRLVQDCRAQPALLVILAWGALTVVFILATIPLDWQRYVMPLYPVETLLAAGGLAWGVEFLWARIKNRPA